MICTKWAIKKKRTQIKSRWRKIVSDLHLFAEAIDRFTTAELLLDLNKKR